MFGPGDRVAGRFEVVRFLAAGGMGHVYEALDHEVGDRVALKTVRPEIAADEKALERFRREIHLARKVTHPNVCRVYDVFRHRSATGEIAVVSMELVEGETLAARLRRVGRLSLHDALPVARAMAEALDAAHAAGVVHGDFKAGNVMLAGPADATRVVVTDFGLARPSEAQEGDAQADPTASLLVTGTAAYMAPEQVEGFAATRRSDVYSFGVVLFQMVTGRLPFQGTSTLSTAVKRLKEPPPRPSSVVPDLSPAWSDAILGCLELDPERRFPSASAAVRAIAGEAGPAGSGRRRRARGWRIAAACAGAAAVLGGLAWSLRRGEAPMATEPHAPRTAVALLGFKNLSGRPEAAWLSVALSEMLRTELAAARPLRAVSGEDVARMKVELSLGDADSLARDTLARVRANLGIDVVVLGSYLALGDRAGGQVRLDLRVQDAAAGETIASVSETGTEAALPDLVSRTGRRLREVLAADAPADAEALRPQLPSHPDARRLYAEGLGRLRTLDALGAREPLERAIAAEPGHPLPHLALSDAWAILGYDRRAADEARRALELSAGLPTDARLWVEGHASEVARHWPRAVEIYRELRERHPDDLDYGLRLAAAQRAAGRANEALQTVAALAARHGGDPRIALAEAAAAEASSDYRRQRESAARAVELGGQRGARMLVSRAHVLEGEALQNLGQPEDARRAFAAARAICEATGDRGGESLALSREGVLEWYQGDPVGARALFEQALAISRAIGDVRGEGRARLNIGNTLADEGDLPAARTAYEAALALFREAGERQGAARALNNIATALREEGDLDQALARFEEAAAAKQEVGDRQGAALTTADIGVLLLLKGDVAGARARIEAALPPLRALGNRHGEAVALQAMGDVLAAMGERRSARQRFEEALAIRVAINERVSVAETRLALATLDAEEGLHDAARGRVVAALPDLQRTRGPDKLAAARLALSRAALAAAESSADPVLAAARLAEARDAAALARELSARGHSARLRLAAEVMAGRVAAAGGDRRTAAATLSRTAAEARRLGFVPLALEAEIHAARAGAEPGPRLARTAREAESLGLRALALSALGTPRAGPR